MTAPENVKSIDAVYMDFQGEGGSGQTTIFGLHGISEASGAKQDKNYKENGRLTLSSNGVIDIEISKNGVGKINNASLGLDDDLKNCSNAFVSLREIASGKLNASVADAMGLFANSYDKKDYIFFTLKKAMALMDVADNAIITLGKIRSDLGSVQNQLQSVINNITITSINLLNSSSTIKDLDFASESADFYKAKIVNQTGLFLLNKTFDMQKQALNILLQ